MPFGFKSNGFASHGFCVCHKLGFLFSVFRASFVHFYIYFFSTCFLATNINAFCLCVVVNFYLFEGGGGGGGGGEAGLIYMCIAFLLLLFSAFGIFQYLTIRVCLASAVSVFQCCCFISCNTKHT